MPKPRLLRRKTANSSVSTPSFAPDRFFCATKFFNSDDGKPSSRRFSRTKRLKQSETKRSIFSNEMLQKIEKLNYRVAGKRLKKRGSRRKNKTVTCFLNVKGVTAPFSLRTVTLS